ncbi:MAG TPA: YtxH domain-containing protein [Thermomicrobiales bacterium]|nr:YtxH domain-containing protein [Thermomicrobiales bacterium]
MTTAERLDTRGALSTLRDIDWEQYLRDPSGDTSSLSLLSGLGLGALVGFVVALLLAPQPGRQAREQIRDTGIELRTRSARWRAGLNEADSTTTLAAEAENAEVELLRRVTQE